MRCEHGERNDLCVETACLNPRKDMRFLIKQQAPNHWYFVLVDASGEAAFISPVRYNSAAEAERVVRKLRDAGPTTPIDIIPSSPFAASAGAV